MQAGAPAWFSSNNVVEDTVRSAGLHADAAEFKPSNSYSGAASKLRINAPAWKPTGDAGDSTSVGTDLWNSISQPDEDWQTIQNIIDANSYQIEDTLWNVPDAYTETTSAWSSGLHDGSQQKGGYTDGGLWVPPAQTASKDLESLATEFHRKANTLVAKERMLTAVKKVALDEEPTACAGENSGQQDDTSTQAHSHGRRYHTKFFNKLPDDVCWDFVKFGHCKRGDWCAWKHIPPEEALVKSDEHVDERTRADFEHLSAAKIPLHYPQEAFELSPARERLPIAERNGLQRTLGGDDAAMLTRDNVAASKSRNVRPPPGFSPRHDVSTPTRDRSELAGRLTSIAQAQSTEKVSKLKGASDPLYQQPMTRPPGFKVQPTESVDMGALVDEQKCLAGTKPRWADIIKK